MAIGPGGNSIFIPTGPAPDYKALIENDPFYKQDLEWLSEAQRIAAQRLTEDKDYSQQLFALNQAQANAAGAGGGDYGLGAAQANAALQKEKAVRDNANRAEYLREWLASRGMASSGQNAWEQNEREYQFGMFNRQIDQDLAARASAAAESRAAAQASLSSQLQEMTLRNQRTLLEFSRDAQDQALGYARDKGQAAFAAYNRLKESGGLNAPGIMALWDPESGLYVTQDGRYFDASGNPTSWSKQAIAPAGGGGGGDGGGGVPDYGGLFDNPIPLNEYGLTPFDFQGPF
jgi:hypothetical protein